MPAMNGRSSTNALGKQAPFVLLPPVRPVPAQEPPSLPEDPLSPPQFPELFLFECEAFPALLADVFFGISSPFPCLYIVEYSLPCYIHQPGSVCLPHLGDVPVPRRSPAIYRLSCSRKMSGSDLHRSGDRVKQWVEMTQIGHFRPSYGKMQEQENGFRARSSGPGQSAQFLLQQLKKREFSPWIIVRVNKIFPKGNNIGG